MFMCEMFAMREKQHKFRGQHTCTLRAHQELEQNIHTHTFQRDREEQKGEIITTIYVSCQVEIFLGVRFTT